MSSFFSFFFLYAFIDKLQQQSALHNDPPRTFVSNVKVTFAKVCIDAHVSSRGVKVTFAKVCVDQWWK